MGRFSSMLDGLTRTFSTSKRRTSSSDQCSGKEAAEAMAKDAKKNEMILRSSGTVNVDGSNNFASVCSRKGEKGVNQDCCIVWEEVERITECNGRVFCLEDEPGLHRMWLPYEESPGLAMSRAFGDYCIKNYGLISVPEVVQRNITCRDQFIVLASDGVWDVVSNEEAVEIVSSTADKAKSAKRLVDYAIRAWKRKRRGIAADDVSAVCLFFHNNQPSSHQIPPVATPE